MSNLLRQTSTHPQSEDPTHYDVDPETVTLASIDQEITKQKLILSHLHNQRNSHSLVSRLPIPVLVDIFIHYASSDYHSEWNYRSPSKVPPSWVGVSYVCRQWREVALSCPTLWTYLFTTSPRWTEELLARSRELPLKIYISMGSIAPFTPRDWFGCVEKVMDHVDRIQEIHLYLPTANMNQVLSKISSRPPRLEYLFIMYADESLESPPELFGGNAPALHTLLLSNCPVPLKSFNTTALTDLRLHDVPVACKQTLEEFLAMLTQPESRLQGLQYLELSDALVSTTGFPSSAAFPALDKIDLPFLSSFSMAAEFSTVVAFLSRVNIPMRTEVRLQLECDPEPDSPPEYNVAMLCLLLARRYGTAEEQDPPSPAIRSLAISAESEAEAFLPRQIVTLAFSENDRDVDPFILVSREMWGCHIPLQITLGRSINDKNRIISDICRAIPLSDVQTLSVWHPPCSQVFWTTLLGHLQEVRYIKLAQGYMPDLSMLTEMDPFLVPKLDELELQYMTFLPMETEPNVRLQRPVMAIKAFARMAHKRSPSTLTFTKCRMGSRALNIVAERVRDKVRLTYASSQR